MDPTSQPDFYTVQRHFKFIVNLVKADHPKSCLSWKRLHVASFCPGSCWVISKPGSCLFKTSFFGAPPSQCIRSATKIYSLFLSFLIFSKRLLIRQMRWSLNILWQVWELFTKAKNSEGKPAFTLNHAWGDSPTTHLICVGLVLARSLVVAPIADCMHCIFWIAWAVRSTYLRQLLNGKPRQSNWNNQWQQNRMEPAEKKKDRKPSLIKRISRKFSLGSKPKLSEEDLIFLVSCVV